MSVNTQAKLIDGKAKSVRQVFTGIRYGLDFYQREYRWTEANVADLIDDLSTRFLHEYRPGAERSDVADFAPYFLGPFVVSSAEGVNNVVDGQQRLTTLTLLLVYLNALAADRDGAEDLSPLYFSQQYGKKSFTIDAPDRALVMKALVDGTAFDPTTSESESARNIWDRFRDIDRLFPGELGGDALLYFIDWLLERVVLVEVGTNDSDMALAIFETMNDRGLRLTNTDMLKSYLVARVGDDEQISTANDKWRHRIDELNAIEGNADAEFLKTWLRAQHAETIREGKKDAAPQDFDIIGTAFHKWVRDNDERLGLLTTSNYRDFLGRDFDVYSRRYMSLLQASREPHAELTAVFYNACNRVTLQYLPIMAAIGVGDDDDEFRAKAQLVATYLDLMVVRRMVNYRNNGYSTLRNTVFALAKDLRGYDTEGVRDVLADRVAGLEDTFAGVSYLGLTGRNRSHIAYLLARMTDWLEGGRGVGFAAYMGRGSENYEVEHIWADHPERHVDEFPNPSDFAARRNMIGDLLLLPKSFNSSYNDKPYDVKLPHYFGQNLLAKSLNPQAYSHNPAFLDRVQRHGLDFKPYADDFTGSDILERQALYQALCEVIWDPDRLGLGGGTANREPRDFYVAFGQGPQRDWGDAQKYGFLSAGGGTLFSGKLRQLSKGDRVFAYIPQIGYVGVGTVTSEAEPASGLLVETTDGQRARLADVPVVAEGMWERESSEAEREWAVGVDWGATVDRTGALKDQTLFANQNVVCRLKDVETRQRVLAHLGLN